MTIWTRLRRAFARSAPETAARRSLRRKDVAGAGAWSWIPGWDGAWGGRSYAARIEAGYRRNAVAYRCVRLIAECAAALPLRLVRAGSVVRHPVPERLLRHPNPATSGAAFFDRLYTTLLLAGEAWLLRLPEDRPDDPQEFHLLPPDRMRKEGRGRGPWPARYVLDGEGERRVFPLDPLTGRGAVLHLVEPHPRDPLTPLARAEVAADAVDVHNAAQAWNKALLDNAARPSGAFVVEARDGAPATLSESQFARLKSDIETLFQGARNAGRPLLLEGGLKWQPMAFSPADMDFINLKHTAARDIALAFGVPPMLLGIPGDNTYSNYQEANRAFWRLTVLPLVKRVTDELTAWLADALPRNARLEPDRDALARRTGERESFWREIDALSFLTPAEKRALAGVDELQNVRALSERKDQPCERDPTSKRWATKGIREARTARFQELERALEKARREGKRVKIWRTQNDDKVRESHRAMEGVAVPIDSPFIVNGERLRLPSDPNGSLEETANCRCFVEYADEQETRAITARKAISAHGEGRTTVIVFTDGSEEVRTGGSRSWRNNNPGNMRQSSFAIRHGSLGEAGGFAVFSSPQTGWDALFALFRGPTYSVLTIEDAIARYAPAGENDTGAYQAFVLSRLNAKGDERLADLSDAQIARLIDAIRDFEGWQEGDVVLRRPAD